ncbi:MAG: hypothetical protein ABI790_11520 [Betaproteobacteria bacterium]
MPSYKLQVQDDDARPDSWRDVKGESGQLLLFDKEPDARARLEELFPVLVKMEKFAAGPKRTRVVIVNPYQDIDQEKED